MDLLTKLSLYFGTEEAVKYRRQLVLLREDVQTSLNKDSHLSVICSGSLGEGLNYPPSDDDLMYVIEEQSLYVYDSYEEAINRRALYMIPSEYSIGFCLIQETKDLPTELALLSSKLSRERFLETRPGFHEHGPCASLTMGDLEYDHAMCLSCPRWPTIASEWITRRRRWPPGDLVEEIVGRGCHVVPIGNPTSPLCDFEWRVSFSLAERSLIHSFNHVQFIIYNLLKLILKGAINILVPNVLCSYYIKTVLYYTIESANPAMWTNNAIEECYRNSLMLLYHFIESKNCPNYFVPENNMMRRKVNSRNSVPLLGIIRELMSLGIVRSLFLCDEPYILNPYFSSADVELMNDVSFVLGFPFKRFKFEYELFIKEKYRNDALCKTLKDVILPVLTSYQQATRSSNPGFLNHVIKQAFMVVGLQCIKISTGNKAKNAYKYQMLKRGEAMLRVGCNTDVSSGRLQLANYLFMTGRLCQCLSIIQTVLSNAAPYVIYREKDASRKVYKEVICNNGYSLDYKIRKAFALDFEFIAEEKNLLAPVPVQLLFKDVTAAPLECQHHVHPLLFSYFLQALCFFQASDFDSMSNSITLLEDTLKYLPRNCLFDSFLGKLLLGYVRMLREEYRSSSRCFTSAFLMKNKLDKNYTVDHSESVKSCVILLSCLLNRIMRTRRQFASCV